jgi:hypothetical protein
MAGCPLLAAYFVLETRRAGIEKLPFLTAALAPRFGSEGRTASLSHKKEFFLYG